MRAPSVRKATRLATIALTISTLAPMTAACGDGEDDGGVTLRFAWWGNADRASVTEQVVDLYEQSHPEVTIETSYAEFTAYFEKLATEVAGGGAPDIMQMDYRYVREYADRNALLEFTGETSVDTSEVTASLLAGGEIDGSLYAIPLGQNTQEFTYDPALWAEAGVETPALGWTWDDLFSAVQQVSDHTGGSVYGASDFGPTEDWFEVWLRQRGKSLYPSDGELGYTAADVADWWTMTNELRESGAVTSADLTQKIDGSTTNDPVAQQKASSGFGYDSSMTEETFEIFGREIALAPFPSDTEILGQYAKPSMQISIYRGSDHPAEAAEFIDFLINSAEAGDILKTSRGMPVNQSIRATIGSTLTGPPKGATTIKSAFQRIYEDVMLENSTPQQAAEALIEEAEEALDSA